MEWERSAYEVLAVATNAGEQEIHLAYRHLARRYHPDGSEPDLARMVEINAAYDQLKTPERRSRYDRTRSDPVAVGPGRSDAWPRERQDFSGLGPLGRRVAAAQEPQPMIEFGPYAGLRVADVAALDPDYLRWLSRRAISTRLRDAIGQCLSNGGLDAQPAGAR